jgi:hypothetical protein
LERILAQNQLKSVPKPRLGKALRCLTNAGNFLWTYLLIGHLFAKSARTISLLLLDYSIRPINAAIFKCAENQRWQGENRLTKANSF